LKGVGKGNSTDADLMRELVFFILHWTPFTRALYINKV
jgi:hypothetical protein